MLETIYGLKLSRYNFTFYMHVLYILMVAFQGGQLASQRGGLMPLNETLIIGVSH